MIELKNKYKNKNATIIFGGPSILENNYDLSLLSNDNNIIFLESKALTPKFIEYGIEPDYYFVPYPEKTRTNSLQNVFLQAIACDFELNKYLKQEYINEWRDFKDRFGEYADIWRIEYPHKKYRIKRDVILENSPLSLLAKFPKMELITYDKAYEADGLSKIRLPNKIFKYTHSEDISGDYNSYFNPKIVNNRLTISSIDHANSSAISLYPILNYMGFDKVFFIGMDMSILGSFEYSSLYTFKTMNHFGKFYNKARTTFSYSFPVGLLKGFQRFYSSINKDLRLKSSQELFLLNKFKTLYKDVYGLQGKFLRPKDEIRNCNELFNHNEVDFINVYDFFKYARPIPDIKKITFDDYIDSNY